MLIPFFNEAGNIQPLLDEVHAALAGVDYEIVCVNDCSSRLDRARTGRGAGGEARPRIKC